jgi:hypothetical protein
MYFSSGVPDNSPRNLWAIDSVLRRADQTAGRGLRPGGIRGTFDGKGASRRRLALSGRCANADGDIVSIFAPERDIRFETHCYLPVDHGVLINRNGHSVAAVCPARRSLNDECIPRDRCNSSCHGLNLRGLPETYAVCRNGGGSRWTEGRRYRAAPGRGNHGDSSTQRVHNHLLHAPAFFSMQERFSGNGFPGQKLFSTERSQECHASPPLSIGCDGVMWAGQIFPFRLRFYNSPASRQVCSRPALSLVGRGTPRNPGDYGGVGPRNRSMATKVHERARGPTGEPARRKGTTVPPSVASIQAEGQQKIRESNV